MIDCRLKVFGGGSWSFPYKEFGYLVEIGKYMVFLWVKYQKRRRKKHPELPPILTKTPTN
jgi:hypothetical protein